MSKNTISQKKYEKGFTMVETLVAIFILLISITGPMAIAQSGLRSAFFSKDQTTAFYLAQDAIEYIKNKRDNNFVNQFRNPASSDWLSGIISESGPVSITIDSIQDEIESCPHGVGCSLSNPLKINQYGEYGFGGDSTKFSRLITINKINDDEISVVVKIEWDTGVLAGIRSIEVKENMFKWYDTYNIIP